MRTDAVKGAIALGAHSMRVGSMLRRREADPPVGADRRRRAVGDAHPRAGPARGRRRPGRVTRPRYGCRDVAVGQHVPQQQRRRKGRLTASGPHVRPDAAHPARAAQRPHDDDPHVPLARQFDEHPGLPVERGVLQHHRIQLPGPDRPFENVEAVGRDADMPNQAFNVAGPGPASGPILARAPLTAGLRRWEMIRVRRCAIITGERSTPCPPSPGTRTPSPSPYRRRWPSSCGRW